MNSSSNLEMNNKDAHLLSLALPVIFRRSAEMDKIIAATTE